jgi:hypothetical protein
MPFKVRCKLINFLGDEEKFPCHFDYTIGDEFYYDGAVFTGKICPSLLGHMAPAIRKVAETDIVLFRYSPLSVRDRSMAKYDGIGFRPLKEYPDDYADFMKKIDDLPDQPSSDKPKGVIFECGDRRTLAQFLCEPVDLASGGYDLPYYNREIALLEKIQAEPGIKTDEIRDRFTEWEREEIYPPLTPIMVRLMLNELSYVNYIELRDGKAYPTGKVPQK